MAYEGGQAAVIEHSSIGSPQMEGCSRTTSGNLYLPIKRWQTRVLKLCAGQNDEPLRGNLLIGTITYQFQGLELEMGQDLTEYEALSYTWGKSNKDFPISINGAEVKITANLEGALKRFRLPEQNRYLWVDQLSINQSNETEKSIQVQTMFTIYNRAKRVLVWLGDSEPCTSHALAYIRASTPRSPTWEEYSGLVDLCSRPWSGRVWIQQEIFAAKAVAVYCGPEKMTLDEYKSVARRLDSLQNDVEPAEVHKGKNEMNSRSIRRLEMASVKHLARLELERTIGTEGSCSLSAESSHDRCTELECIFAEFQQLEATCPQDRVYALLSLTNCRTSQPGDGTNQEGYNALDIDYTRTYSQVLQDVTKYIINRDRSLNFLFDASGLVRAHRPRGPLPSWAPNWPALEHHWTRYDRYCYRTADNLLIQRTAEGPSVPGLKSLPWQYSSGEDSITVSGVALGIVLQRSTSGGFAMQRCNKVGGIQNMSLMDYKSLVESMISSFNAEWKANTLKLQSFSDSDRGVEDGYDPYVFIKEDFEPNAGAADLLVHISGTLAPIFLRRLLDGKWTVLKCLRKRDPEENAWLPRQVRNFLGELDDYSEYEQEFVLH